NRLFNLLCIPSKKDLNFLDDAAKFCLDHRAVFLVDSPTGWTDVGKAVTGAADTDVSGDNAKNAALYFPRLELLDEQANLETYPPVRRTALFIEGSLYRGTEWVVVEPNDEPLWASIRLNVGAFMNSLWRQGAFQGTTPREAYLVKCDSENNPQNDIDRGIVN